MAHQIRNSTAADGYHHGDLRRALIDAALALMTEEQDWTFSLREVARRAGVSHNAPYNHFADKRELLAALAVLGLEAIRARMLDSILGIDAPDAALIRTGMVYVKFGLENPAHYRLMFSSALVTGGAGRPAVVEDAGARTREVLESIIRRGARAGVFAAALARKGELQSAVLAAWSAVHGLTMLAIDGLPAVPRRTIDHIADKLSRIVCRGLLR